MPNLSSPQRFAGSHLDLSGLANTSPAHSGGGDTTSATLGSAALRGRHVRIELTLTMIHGTHSVPYFAVRITSLESVTSRVIGSASCKAPFWALSRRVKWSS